jgi:hypothetical protein
VDPDGSFRRNKAAGGGADRIHEAVLYSIR